VWLVPLSFSLSRLPRDPRGSRVESVEFTLRTLLSEVAVRDRFGSIESIDSSAFRESP